MDLLGLEPRPYWLQTNRSARLELQAHVVSENTNGSGGEGTRTLSNRLTTCRADRLTLRHRGLERGVEPLSSDHNR